MCLLVFYIKQKTAYELRISDWSSDVCSSDLHIRNLRRRARNDRLLARADHHRRRVADVVADDAGERQLRRHRDQSVDHRSEARREGKECVSTYISQG